MLLTNHDVVNQPQHSFPLFLRLLEHVYQKQFSLDRLIILVLCLHFVSHIKHPNLSFSGLYFK